MTMMSNRIMTIVITHLMITVLEENIVSQFGTLVMVTRKRNIQGATAMRRHIIVTDNQQILMTSIKEDKDATTTEHTTMLESQVK